MYYIAKVGQYAQYKFAFYEISGKAIYADNQKLCPSCGARFGRPTWLPPHRVTIKQPRNIGDFVSGAGGADMLISRRMYDEYCRRGLTGIDEVYEPIDITKMGISKKSKSLLKPDLVGVGFVILPILANESEMNVEYDYWPSHEGPPCPTCHCERSYIKYDRVKLYPNQSHHADFFYSTSMLATLFLSEKGKDMIVDCEFTNIECVPSENVTWIDPTYEIIMAERRNK